VGPPCEIPTSFQAAGVFSFSRAVPRDEGQQNGYSQKITTYIGAI